MGLLILDKNNEDSCTSMSYSIWHIIVTLLNKKGDLTEKLMKEVNDVECEIEKKHSKIIAEALFVLNESDCTDVLHELGLSKIETTEKQLICPYCGMFETKMEDEVCTRCGGSRKTIHVWADNKDYNMQIHFDFQSIYEIARFFKDADGVVMC